MFSIIRPMAVYAFPISANREYDMNIDAKLRKGNLNVILIAQ